MRRTCANCATLASLTTVSKRMFYCSSSSTAQSASTTAGIELGSGATAQLGPRLRHRQSVPVGMGRAHRVIGVADGDDSRPDGDLLPARSIRIALSVQTLLHGAHQRGDRRQRRRRPHDPLADQRVLADEQALVGIERSGLEQDRVRQRDLADVMQLGPALDVLGPRGRRGPTGAPPGRRSRPPSGGARTGSDRARRAS